MTKFLFVTDLDNTLVGDDDALAELNQHLHHHREENGTLIVYATGRSLALYRELSQEKSLLDPDILVLSVGTMIYHNDSKTPDPQWTEILSHQWDREQVVATAAHFSDLTPQPETEQAPFKASYFLSQEVAEDLLPRLEAALTSQNLDIQLVYSSGQDLDILPKRGNKGEAIAFLQNNIGMAPAQTVVCGDSGNDIGLFAVAEARGIIVGNAQPELREWHQANPSGDRYVAKSHCAGGILEGLRHFGFLS